MKKLQTLGCLLALLMAAVILFPAKAKAADEVAINSTSFPDKSFRMILEDFDTDEDGKLSKDEIREVTSLDVSDNETLTSLKGIEYLTELEKLKCVRTGLTKLDLSKNTKLKEVKCGECKLTSLTLPKGDVLETLDCSKNSLTKLTVSGCTGLEYLYCSDNQLTSLYVSQLPKLWALSCDGNQLTSLNVTNNTGLVYLFCSDNQLTSLNVTKNVSLACLSCGGNQLTSLNLKYNKWLDNLICARNLLGSLNITNNTELRSLSCQYNELTSLNLTKNPELTYMACKGNNIAELDIHLNPYLQDTYVLGSASSQQDSISYSYHYDDPPINGPVDTYLSIDNTTKVIVSVPKITTQPKSKTVEPGNKVTFKVAAEGGGLSYQWYYKKPGDTSWTKVSSTAGKKASYSLTAEARHYKYQYRCKVTNAAGSKYSNTVTLTVKTKPVITSPTAASTKSVKKGASVSFTVKADAAESYQWYYRTSSSGEWKAVSAASGKTATYTMTAASKHNGYQYRCKVKNPFGSVYTKITTLKVTS